MNGMLTDLQNFDLYSLVDTIRKEVCPQTLYTFVHTHLLAGTAVKKPSRCHPSIQMNIDSILPSMQVSITDMLGETGLQHQDVGDLLALRSQVRHSCIQHSIVTVLAPRTSAQHQ